MTWCFKTSLQLPKGQLSFVENWPVMNPNDLLFIIITYLVFVFKAGPYLMENRAPFQLRRVMLFYNAVKIINSVYLCYKFLMYIIDKGLFPKFCKYDDLTIYTIAALYWKYMAAKIVDLCDTVFYILRKKNNQVTFLHVYHHLFVLIITWTSLKYDPSDHWAFMAAMNCGIHAVMYSYYGIAALGPDFTKYLWWKKYLTLMQLAQFFLAIGHVIIQTYTTECPMHASTYWIGLSNLALFIVLFADFYKRRYHAKDKVENCVCATHID